MNDNDNLDTHVIGKLTCWCGSAKAYQHAVCGSCWRKLNATLKEALYLRYGQGFEESYRRAIDYLKEKAARQASAAATAAELRPAGRRLARRPDLGWD